VLAPGVCRRDNLPVLSDACIYTIRHSRVLAECSRLGGDGEFTENTYWKRGRELFVEALREGEQLAVLFSPADTWDGVMYWAVLTDVSPEQADSERGTPATTTFAFRSLTPVRPPRRLSELQLLRNGKRLSDRDIRPYRICRTPAFLR
jgi:hypothetical protein